MEHRVFHAIMLVLLIGATQSASSSAVDQYLTCFNDQKLPTDEDFNQFQERHPISPTEMLRYVARADLDSGRTAREHISILVKKKADLFAESEGEGIVSPFVSLTTKFLADPLLEILRSECPDDTLKSGLKRTLAQLAERPGCYPQFRVVRGMCKKAGLASRDYQEVVEALSAYADPFKVDDLEDLIYES